MKTVMKITFLLAIAGLVINDGTLQGAQLFTDVTAASGIKVNLEKRPGRPEYGTQRPHGVAVEDFDGDGLQDVLLVCFGEPYVQLFRNVGGMKFVDVTKGSGLEIFKGWGTGAAVGDFNRDGKLDVYLTSVAWQKEDRAKSKKGWESRLFEGRGDGKFADVSAKAGVLLDRPGRCCAWSDVDGDGWLDLFVACPNTPSLLFRNNRNGTFTDVTKQANVALDERMSLGCAFGDVDGDGLDDLFVANYRSQVSALLKNLGGGKFREVTAKAGLDRKAAAVGCVFADVGNRGRLDLHVTTDSWLSGANYTEKQLLERGHTVEPNVLYENDGKGRFRAAEAETLLHKTLSHDAVLQDFDHDGLIDVYVGVDAIPTGNRFATHKGGNPAWTRRGGKWVEVRKEWGVGFESNCVCVPAADFDNDGDLDLLLVNFYKNVVLYRNNTNDKNWLKVKPVGVKSNLDGIGAQVRLFRTQGNKRTLVGFRHVQAGAGYGRSSPLEAHFGLGPKPASTYEVEVFFPATKTRVVKKSVKPTEYVVVREK